MNPILTISQGVIFLSFIGFILVRFKRPLPSISDSWYELVGFEKNLFTFFCWSLGFTMFFQTSGDTGFFFLSGAGLCFTGAATAFKEDMTKIVHSIGAITAILGAFLAIFIERGNILPFLLFGACVSILYRVKNHIWWIEIAAFCLIFYGLIVK